MIDPLVDPYFLLWPRMTLMDGSVLLVRSAWSPGSAVSGQKWEMTEVVLLDPSGESIDTVGSFPLYELGMPGDGGRPVIVEFGGHGQLVSGQDGFGWQLTDQTEIRLFRLDGVLDRIVRWTEDRVPVNSELWDAYVRSRTGRAPGDRSGQRSRMEERLRLAPRGEYFHATGLVHTDSDGHLWVVKPNLPGVEGPERARVFSPDGEWVGDVDLPVDVRITGIGRDYLSGVVRDELGIPFVVIHRVERQHDPGA
jgi:hypothetical protein